MPVSGVARSSVTPMLGGAVTAGPSFTAVTVTVACAVVDSSSASRSETVTERVAGEGSAPLTLV
jgi:hypothetical protein